jgi:hypothetical protein
MLGTENLMLRILDHESRMLRTQLSAALDAIRARKNAVLRELESMVGITASSSCDNNGDGSAATLPLLLDESSAFDRRQLYQEMCDRVVKLVHASATGKSYYQNGAGDAALEESTTLPLPSAASRFHRAVSEFAVQIGDSTLASLRTVKVGGIVLVTSRPLGITVRGEIVHLEGTSPASITLIRWTALPTFCLKV